MRDFTRKVGIVLSGIVALFSIWFAIIGIPMDTFPEGTYGVITTQYVSAPIANVAALLAGLFMIGLIKRHLILTFVSIFALLVFSFLTLFSGIGLIYLPITTVMLIFGIFAILPKGPPKSKRAARSEESSRPSEMT